MNERKLLAQRRELVALSAELQRQAIVTRFERLQENKLPAVISLAMQLAARPWARTALLFALGRLLRRFFRKPGPSASKAESHS